MKLSKIITIGFIVILLASCGTATNSEVKNDSTFTDSVKDGVVIVIDTPHMSIDTTILTK